MGEISNSEIVDRLLAMIEERGHTAYGSEPVSQYDHALQTAMLAEAAGAPPPLIAAALLHDLGHLLHGEGERPAEYGVDAHHEIIAENYLRRWFGQSVTAPIVLHVAAKRHLCAVEPGYRAALSPASERSLMLQGGPYTATESAVFLAGQHAEAALALRYWDDQAKVPGLAVAPLSHYAAALSAALTG